MPSTGLKAILAILSAGSSRRPRRARDLLILAASMAVTLGLISIYLFGKATARW